MSHHVPHRHRRLAAAVASASLALGHAQAFAADRYFKCTGTAFWDTTCWSSTSSGTPTLGQPISGDRAVIDMYQSSSDRTVNYRHIGTGTLLSGLEIRGGESGSGTVTLNINRTDSTLRTDYTKLITNYSNAEAVINHSAGSHQVTNALTVAGASYFLSGTGTLATHDTEVVDWGAFTQSGGNHTVANSLTVGSDSMYSGTPNTLYTLSGGTLSTQSTWIGGSGNRLGKFAQSGGSHLVSGSLTSEFNYYLSGGLLSTGSSKVGNIFDHSGGAHQVAGDLKVTGAYTMTGGSVSAASESISGSFSQLASTHAVAGVLTLQGGQYTLGKPPVRGLLDTPAPILTTSGTKLGYVGMYGTTGESFEQLAGSHNITGLLSVALAAGGEASYVLSGGSLNTQGSVIGAIGTGSLTQTAGRHTVSGDLVLGRDAGAAGSYVLSAGSLSAGNSFIGVAGSGAFTQSGGTHTIGGVLTLGTASSYLLSGGTLTANSMLINDGGSLTLDGGIANGGLIDQRGTLQVTKSSTIGANINLTAQSTTTVDAVLTLNGTLNSKANAVSGLSVGGNGALAVGTSGGISGNGVIGVDVSNAGLIQAKGGNLTLEGAHFINTGTLRNGVGANLFVNAATVSHSGNIEVNSAGAVVFEAPIAIAARQQVLLKGGTLSTPTLTNAVGGMVIGFGTVAANMVNQGSIDFYGPTNVVGDFDNQAGATLLVRNNQTLVTGHMTNNGTIQTLKGTAIFEGGLTNNGAYLSDPSDNYFSDLTVTQAGYLVGETGDRFILTGAFDNRSQQAALWNTAAASLLFVGLGAQDLYLPGADLGATGAGYAANFAWADLTIGMDASLVLHDGNTATAGGAFYAGEVLGAKLAGDAVANIDGNGFNLRTAVAPPPLLISSALARG